MNSIRVVKKMKKKSRWKRLKNPRKSLRLMRLLKKLGQVNEVLMVTNDQVIEDEGYGAIEGDADDAGLDPIIVRKG